MLDNTADDIYELLVDEETGNGQLIELISFDIKYDGVRPPHEVMTCTGAACSSVPPTAETQGRVGSLVFLALPATILVGVVLWRRRLGKDPA
jgi:hypothetical protein